MANKKQIVDAIEEVLSTFFDSTTHLIEKLELSGHTIQYSNDKYPRGAFVVEVSGMLRVETALDCKQCLQCGKFITLDSGEFCENCES